MAQPEESQRSEEHLVRATGSWTYSASVREAQAQRAALHEVRATLLQTALPWNVSEYVSEANARWTAPDGQVRTGQVLARSGAAAGSTTMVWINQAGQLTDPPLQNSQVIGRVSLSRVLVIAALAVTLLVVGLTGRWALDRRRLAAWDAEWLAAGPRWMPGGRTPARGD